MELSEKPASTEPDTECNKYPASDPTPPKNASERKNPGVKMDVEVVTSVGMVKYVAKWAPILNAIEMQLLMCETIA